MSGILVENISKAYGKRAVLEKISFHITQPGIYLLAGPNGSGKTTLMELVAGLRKAASGKIELNGFQTGGMEAKHQIGFLCQQNNVRKNCTVKEELALIKTIFNKQMDDLAYLRQFGLESYYHHKTKKLSGGLQRRLLIALTLMADQKIMMMDEPASGLDTDNRDEIWNLIKEHSKEKIILVSDHYLNQAASYCDFIFMMDKGKILLQDKKERFFKQMEYSKVIRVKKHNYDEVKKAVDRYCPHYSVKSRGSVYYIFIKNDGPELNTVLKNWHIDCFTIELEDIYFYYTGKTLYDKGEIHEYV